MACVDIGLGLIVGCTCRTSWARLSFRIHLAFVLHKHFFCTQPDCLLGKCLDIHCHGKDTLVTKGLLIVTSSFAE